MKNKAIIFNCSYNGLSIIQELAHNMVHCIAMDSRRNIGTFSKFSNYVKCPDPLTNESDFITFLWKYCKKEKYKPVLFPTNDEWAMAISRHKDKLSAVSIPCVCDYELINIILYKNRFYELGNRKKYLTPITWKWNEVNSINKFPVIAKPNYRAISGNDSQLKKHKKFAKSKLRLKVLYNKDELFSYIKTNSTLKNHFIFQEYIRGDSDRMFTVGVYASKESNALGVFTGRKVRGYPAEYGDCIVGENHSVPDYVIENTLNIIRDLGYTGIAEFEYKKDQITDQFYLIEINPRAWSWIGITPYCGVNLPLIAYQDMLGLPQQQSLQRNLTNGEIKYVKIYQDFFNCLIRYRFSFPKWKMSYKQWASSLSSCKLVKAECHLKDYRIMLYSMFYVLIKLLKNK